MPSSSALLEEERKKPTTKNTSAWSPYTYVSTPPLHQHFLKTRLDFLAFQFPMCPILCFLRPSHRTVYSPFWIQGSWEGASSTGEKAMDCDSPGLWLFYVRNITLKNKKESSWFWKTNAISKLETLLILSYHICKKFLRRIRVTILSVSFKQYWLVWTPDPPWSTIYI